MSLSQGLPVDNNIISCLAYQIRKSKVLVWDRNYCLTHVILPMGRIKKENFHMNLVCIGCKKRHITLSLGSRHCDVTITSNFKMFCVNVIMYGNENSIPRYPVFGSLVMSVTLGMEISIRTSHT